MDNPLLEYSVWEKTQKYPSKENGINDIQLAAEIIYELHKIPNGAFIQQEDIINKLHSKYNAPEDQIINILYTLSKQRIIGMSSEISEKEPSYEIHNYSFGLQKVNDTHPSPWYAY